MTYYECISILKEINNTSQYHELILKLNDANIEFYNDVKYRFAIHLIEVIKAKENKTFDKFLSVITSQLVDFETFSLETYSLKKELSNINQITKIKIIPKECQKEIVEVYQNIIHSYNKFIEELLTKYYQEVFVDEYYNIINRKEEKL